MAANAQENYHRMLAGELYYANTPELNAVRLRCKQAIKRFNAYRGTSRRVQVELWRDIVQDTRSLPSLLEDIEADAAQFSETDPFVEPPVCMDYGTQVHVAGGSFINANSTWIDTCHIYVGKRVLFAPNVSCYSGTHPLDPAVRDGLSGPEMGKEIHIEDDCWIGGNAIILPGVTVGRGSTVGAGSVVTKDVPPFHVVAGNPARILRKIETNMDKSKDLETGEDASLGAEVPMAELAHKIEEQN